MRKSLGKRDCEPVKLSSAIVMRKRRISLLEGVAAEAILGLSRCLGDNYCLSNDIESSAMHVKSFNMALSSTVYA